MIYAENTSARPPNYDGEYPEKLATPCTGNPMGVTKSKQLLFKKQDEMSAEESTSLEKQIF